MKKGFYVLKNNLEESISSAIHALYDGEKFFLVRYRPGQKEFYLCDFNIGVYGNIVPVEKILKDVQEAILFNSDLVSYHGDTLSYEQKSKSIEENGFKYYNRNISLKWINNEFSFSIGEKKEISL